MKLLNARSWSVTTRLVTIAVATTIMMGSAVSAALYINAISEVNAELRERGELAAAMLADASRYGLTSGNVPALEGGMRAMLQSTPSIAAIEILDPDHHVVARSGALTSARDLPTFERQVSSDVPEVNLFDQVDVEPHVSGSADAATKFRAGHVIGYARVVMSPEPLIRAKRDRLLLGAAIIAASAVISIWYGVWLAGILLRRPLGAVMSALGGLRRGSFDAELDLDMPGEIGDLNRTIVEVARSLGASHAELEKKVAARTSELQHVLEERRRLIASGNAALEHERERIAGDIHDSLNAELIVVRMQADQAASMVDQVDSEALRDELRNAFDRLDQSMRGLYSSARRIVKQLRPEVIDTLGLVSAVREVVRTYDELHPACRFELDVEQDFPALRGEQAITAFRLIQEAFSNVVKHARATNATVYLSVSTAQPRSITVTVADDGVGFNPDAGSAGVGLIGMQERATACGGTMTIRSEPDSAPAGTTIIFRLPIE